VFTRVVAGRALVVREVRAAGPLMEALKVPAPSRGPWLSAVLGLNAARSLPARLAHRPTAVVVEEHPAEAPAAVAFLTLHRQGPMTTVSLLGSALPCLPGGLPPFRLLARDDAAAGLLAAGVLDLLARLGGAWWLRLAGLPMGDPVVRVLADRLPRAVVATSRSVRLVDELDGCGPPVQRGTDPVWIDRWLPAVLGREPDPRVRQALRVLARVHAAAGELELAVVPGPDADPADGERPAAAQLTLVDGAGRWPWWGSTDLGGLRTEMGAPLVGVTARGGWELPQLPVVALRPRRSVPPQRAAATADPR
jgi:hypothetical protein